MALHPVKHKWKAARNQAAEGEVCGDGIVCKQKFEQARQNNNGKARTRKNGKKQLHALLEFAAQMRNGVDEFIVQAHCHHHGPAADARNDIGNAHHDALQYFFQHSVFSFFLFPCRMPGTQGTQHFIMIPYPAFICKAG